MHIHFAHEALQFSIQIRIMDLFPPIQLIDFQQYLHALFSIENYFPLLNVRMSFDIGMNMYISFHKLYHISSIG